MRQSSRCCRSDSLGCLPRNFPLARAMAMPSRVRMRMRPASNSAKVARILKNLFPIGSPKRRAPARGPVSGLVPEADRRWRAHPGRTWPAGRVSALPACRLRARRRGPGRDRAGEGRAGRLRCPLDDALTDNGEVKHTESKHLERAPACGSVRSAHGRNLPVTPLHAVRRRHRAYPSLTRVTQSAGLSAPAVRVSI